MGVSFWDDWYQQTLTGEHPLLYEFYDALWIAKGLADAQPAAAAINGLWSAMDSLILDAFPMLPLVGNAQDQQQALLAHLIAYPSARTTMTQLLKDWEATSGAAAKTWMKEVFTTYGFGTSEYMQNHSRWHQLMRTSMLDIPYNASWMPYLSSWLDANEWRRLMSPEFVVQAMYAADPFRVIAAEADYAENHDLMVNLMVKNPEVHMESLMDLLTSISSSAVTASVLNKKTLSLATHVMYGSSRLGTMDYLPMQYGMSYERIGLNERTRDTLGLSGHRPYYAFAGHQLATGGQGIYGQHSWASLPHKGQHLIGQKQYELSNHLGNVQVTVSDLPFKQKVNDTLVFSTALKSVYDYYPFGMMMPGRTVMDTARKCVDMTRLERVWQPAVIHMDPLTPYFMNISGWGAANYEFRDGNTQLLIEIEDSKSGLEIALDPSITEGEIVLKTKVFEIFDNGILLRVQGVDSNGDVWIFYQSHEQIIEESLVIPLKAGYTHYSILIQGAVSMAFDGGTIYNGHWVETEVLVRVCDDGGDQYRFGFNGQEKVNEVSGMGNHLDFGARYYDSRVGRLNMSTDPLQAKFPYQSPYVFAGNDPVLFIDKNGEYKVSAENEANYKKDYPLIMKYLATQIEYDISNSEKIINGLIHTNPNITANTIKSMAKWGGGPEIQFVEKPGEGYSEYATAGGYCPIDYNTIQLNAGYAKYVEDILASDVSVMEKLVAFTRFYKTLIHETGHHLNKFGNYRGVNQLGNDFYEDLRRSKGRTKEEHGYKAEEYIWGTSTYKPYSEPFFKSGKQVKGILSDGYKEGITEGVINEAMKTEEGKKTLPTIP